MNYQIYFDEENEDGLPRPRPMIIQEGSYSSYAVNDNKLPKELLLKRVLKTIAVLIMLGFIIYMFL